MTTIQNVTVLGVGVLGSQIAFQSAYHGKTVMAYDLSQEAVDGLPERWDYLRPLYLRDLEDATPEKLDAAVGRITGTTDLATAVADADLVIEAVPEVLEIKRDTWQKVSESAPERTIFATNSSTLLPSAMADATDRPEKFLALHFANEIWRNNIGEVMGHEGTDQRWFEAVADFAEEIGMVPVRVRKEQPGYVLNSLLVPFLNAAADLLVRGVADVEDIDLTWRTSTGAPLGPFQIYDVIGMTTPYNLAKSRDDESSQKFAKLLKEEYIDKGKLGVPTGEGFYRYG
ncbi:3-hydroxybutyryl-CoA dehydrogenase [Ornithinimicrobium sp. CNJ-824]|uniref:3-hydroxyacyl-CoA dehydrogenase n=1 Tax=Ornithinimicrobium sp. CNJ-824 TaxID=1904966 RepID=UPI00096851C3|nr:3-hydroxyacyl-CoA dehydrogenase [Ornithinimicrobium sp. CNJ-824]OLT20009.1 3-hydroxybutyryl-CoA dehydrogenase [Ornithinimicrobium sp. CNJ-824]